jgi:hypothetical protein
MLKSWETSPRQSASDAATRQKKSAWVDRVTVAASSGLPCHRPENEMTAPQSPTSAAAHNEN